MSKPPKYDNERPHCVDDIKELDNPLPRWWVWLFNGTIVFGVCYMIWIHLAGGPLLLTELRQDLELKKSAGEQKVVGLSEGQPSGSGGPEATNLPATNLATQVRDPAFIKEGEAHYVSYCSPCHRPDLGGQIGPNLTDDYWIHGCTPEAVVKTIAEGVPEKGMAAWAPILGEKKIIEVTAYIYSKLGSQPPNPKEQQGELCVWKPQ